MQRFLNRLAWAGLLAAGGQSALAFSLLGPIGNASDSWQVTDLGFNKTWYVDIGAPKNLGEGYRRNTPVMYYACDANFLNYFGSLGLQAVDQAYAIFNGVFNFTNEDGSIITNVDNYSQDLSEFPLEATRANQRAAALGVLDLKTVLMSLMMENLGLADPVRFTWNLHDRYLPPGATCPLGEVYLVVQRNFDPAIGTSVTQPKPSSYVNGVLYDYQIHDYCTVPPGVLDSLSEALEFSTDPVQSVTRPVASFILNFGDFYTGLTRDDAGGLRYQLTSANINFESASPNTTDLVTNFTPTLLTTSNLTLLSLQALTNNAAALQALYPGLVVTASSNWFGVVATTNSIPYFTNYPWDPFGTPAHLKFTSTITYSVVTFFRHTFGNVFILTNTPTGWMPLPLTTLPGPNGQLLVTLQTISVTNNSSPWTPAGTNVNVLFTNITTRTFYTNAVVGDFFILPTNSCGVSLISALLTNVTLYTNVLISSTNNAGTNGVTSTNVVAGQSYERDLILYLTNHIFFTFPIDCNPTTTALREGVQKMRFIRRDFDSLLTRFFTPVTNEYTINSIATNAIVPERIQRVITAPDFLITAADLSPGPAALDVVNSESRGINFNQANIYPGLAGPGTIEPATTFTFNKASPIYENTGMLNTNAFLTSFTQIPWVVWGSFDGTTNPVVIYPNDFSINNLENAILVQITPANFPDGFTGIAYQAQLQAQASTPNWRGATTWALAPGSAGLPPGLALATNGLISGTPTADGFYDFVIRATDAQGHTLDRAFSIRIGL